MEAKIIANAFNALTGVKLREVYSMYVEMTSLDLFGSAWNKELEQAMALQVEKLATLQEDEIRLQLILQLLQTTNQRAVQLNAQEAYELACARLLGATGETSVQPLIEATWQTLLNNMAHEWQLLSQMERTHIANGVFQYVVTFSAAEREAFQRALDMPQMTARHFEQVLTERGIRETLQVVAELFGMAIYPIVVNHVVDIEKIDIPLGFFTLIDKRAVAAVSGSFLTYRIANKSMKRQMIPAIIVQVVLPYMLADQPYVEPLVQLRWERVSRYYDKLNKALSQIDTLHQESELALQALHELTHILTNKIKTEQQNVTLAEEKLYELLLTMPDVPKLEPYATIVQKLRADIEKLQRLQETKVITHSLFDKVKSATKNLEHRAKMKTMDISLKRTLQKMAVDVLKKRVPYDDATQLLYDVALEQISQYEQEQQLVQQKITQKTEAIRDYIAQYETLEQQLFDVETRYPTLRTMYVVSKKKDEA